MTELLKTSQPIDGPEIGLVQQVTGLDPLQLDGSELEEYNGYVSIVSQFSRLNQTTGRLETISPSRAEAIPAISARFRGLVELARGRISTAELVSEWASNMPANDGSRHPDLLFDITQYNFGHDGPVTDIVRGLTAAEIRRKELVSAFRSNLRHSLAQLRYQHSRVDIHEEVLDELIDSI